TPDIFPVICRETGTESDVSNPSPAQALPELFPSFLFLLVMVYETAFKACLTTRHDFAFIG
ncbi:hypothetical protein, partial [Cronobacter malonaticus]|uniref:hypothetical protein n=1 Tax=Cronobacter malonaticus TaxID=413503 RepID=UPI001F3EA491